MNRYLSLLLFIGLAWGQDKIVTVKLKNGEVIRGKVLHGENLNDYYVRLLTEDKKIKDIYTINIVSVKDQKPLTKSLSSKPKLAFIPYDLAPRAKTVIRPIYPETAQNAGIEGVVVVQAFIDERGRVKETLILKGVPNTGLDEAAMEAIRRTKFHPAEQRERPVAVWISIPVNFRLK